MADAVMIRRPKICLSTGTHTYETPTYRYSSGHSKCTGSTTCTQCNKRLTETATGRYRTSASATCTTGTRYDYKYTWTNSDIFTKSACPDYHYEDDALGHNPVSDNNSVSATCTTSGKTSSYSCSRCGTETTASSTIAALGHNPGSWTTATSATCTTSGTKIKRCTRCNTQVDSQTIDALGHNPTYGGTAEVHTKCSRCSVTISAEHDSWDSSLTSSTAWDSSHESCTMYQSCSCGYSQGFAATVSIVTITPSTCVTLGTYHHKALSPTGEEAYCGTTHSLASYNFSNHDDIQSSYLSNGLTGHYYLEQCMDCQEVVQRIPANTSEYNSHSYSNLSSVSSTRHIGKCSVCGYAAYQEHYAADKPKFTGVAEGETWLCEGCNYDTGKSVLSTGSSVSGFTSPFSYIFAPSWTN